MKKLIAFIMALTMVISFASCGKKEIVGYDPELSPEWIELFEEAENSPTKEIVRTGDFAGIWQNELTGEYYHIFNGKIYLVERPDANEDEVEDWGSATVVQIVERAVADEYMISGSAERQAGEEMIIYYDSIHKTEEVEKIIVLETDRTKVVTKSGREITFKFIKNVSDYAAGYGIEYELTY